MERGNGDPGAGSRAPLVIGLVTQSGVADSERFEEPVRRLFASLRRACPHTPFLVLSALERPVEQRLARAALETPDTKLIVLRPAWPGRAAAEATSVLLDRAAFVLATPDDEAAEAYVARCCQMLLAVWDGDERAEDDTTAQVVNLKLQSPVRTELTGDWSHGEHEGPVASVIVPDRDSSRFAAATPVQWSLPEPWDTRVATSRWRSPSRLPAPVAAFVRRFDELNREIRRASRRAATWQRDTAASSEALLPGAVAQRLPAACQDLLAHYTTVDVLATRLAQRRSRLLQAFLWAFGLGVSTMIALTAAATLRPALLERFQDLQFEVAALPWLLYLLGYGLYASRTQALDYRALAEGLRVQLFWALADVAEDASEHHLRHQRGGLLWVRCALHAQRLLLVVQRRGTTPVTVAPLTERLDWVAEYWLGAQLQYYDQRTRYYRRRLRRHVEWINLCCATGVVLYAVWLWHYTHPTGRGRFWLDGLKGQLISFTFLFAVAVGWFGDALALPDHTRRYYRMSLDLSLELSKLRRTLGRGDLEAASRQLADLGRKVLAENGEWLVIQRDRQMIRPGV